MESIVLGAKDWIWISAIALLAISAMVIWSYSQRSHLSGLRFLAVMCKVLAVASLALCLLEPMKRTERPRPGANIMAMVVDTSRSMEIRAPEESMSRLERMRPALQSEATWQSRLAQDFDVRRYVFSDRLQARAELGELDFEGNNSSLQESITTLQNRFSKRPVAGMVLFSDGLATDKAQELLNDEFSFPIYPVVLGEETQHKDLVLSNAAVTVSSFELAPASVEATLEAIGLHGSDVVVRLIDSKGETLEQQRLTLDSDQFSRRVRFQFQPSEPGFQFVSMRAMLAREDGEAKELTSRVEVTTANNQLMFPVNRGGGPFRILYVAGRPNWEFKFLRRALEEDVEIKLQGLVRIAKKEPKFSFRDKGVEDVNPLVAGFSDNEETAEQYDEPVLVRIGVGDEDQLKAGFPSSEESLYFYHAIIIDDLESSFFTPQQMMLLRKFVADRGGGLLMLGGQESFIGGGYLDTPLGDVLPVYLRGQEKRELKDLPLRYQPTRDGALQPWLRLRANESDERQRLEEMPGFQVWNSVSDVKPGATVLSELIGAGASIPGLVSQRFGEGRSLALLVGDFWRWSMHREKEETDDLAQNWRQIVRWLTTDVPKRIEVDVAPPEQALEPFRVAVRVRDSLFKPLDNASVQLTVTEPDGKEVKATATLDSNKPGLYVADYWAQSDGGYRCQIDVIGPDGEVFDPLQTGWAAQPSAIEFAKVQVDHDFLQSLAERSGGEVVKLDDLESFVAELPTKKVPISEARIEPLWHQPWLIVLAIGFLCLEWGLRRWKGLP
ncbi:MAG: hypothetical protein KDB03_26475 [Planctomycetales bacterium]|nr:hypothetical protein [Planctomycetales bacterium]